jgi:hypothetical protein
MVKVLKHLTFEFILHWCASNLNVERTEEFLNVQCIGRKPANKKFENHFFKVQWLLHIPPALMDE